MEEKTAWKLINIFHILSPILLLLFAPDLQLFIGNNDAVRHLTITDWHFCGGAAPAPNYMAYPHLSHILIYALSFFSCNNLMGGYIFLIILAAILFRFAIYLMLYHKSEPKKLLYSVIIFEGLPLFGWLLSFLFYLPKIPPFNLFIRYDFAGQPRFIGSIEMLSLKVGFLPSFLALGLSLLALSFPTLIFFIMILMPFLSNSGAMLLVALGIVAFLKSKNFSFLVPICYFLFLNKNFLIRFFNIALSANTGIRWIITGLTLIFVFWIYEPK